jgi:ataxia telangiectasia mutated family protein
VNKVAGLDLLDWFGRIKLIDCICDFVLLHPQIGQVITNISFLYDKYER